MTKRQIPIDMLNPTSLAEHVSTTMGLDVHPRMGLAGIKARMATAGFPTDFIDYDDGKDDEVPIARVEPPRQRHKPNHRSVQLRIEPQDKPGGNEAVFTSVNGVPFLIPRQLTCWVPYRYYEALMHAVAKAPITDEDSKITGWRDVPEYPVSVFHVEPPLTAAEQIHRLQQIVEFVKEAYIDIQAAHLMWRWLRSYFTGQTVIGENHYLGTDFTDEHDGGAITRFSQWDFKRDMSDAGLSIFLTSTGNTEEGPLRWLDWDRFYQTQLRGPQTPGKPQFYSISNDDHLMISPPPDAVYTLRGGYRKSPQMLALDADVPEMPSEFHTIIKDAALQYVEGFDEGPRIPIIRLRMLPNWSMLETHQLPQVSWGPPLA
jgi:hypothetical protein